MNEMSSRAKTFVGSAMARASEFPIFLTGITSYFLAMGAGTSLSTSGSMSSWASVMDGAHLRRGASLFRDRLVELLGGEKTVRDQEVPEPSVDRLPEFDRLSHCN